MHLLSLRARLVLGVLVLAGLGLFVADSVTYASLRSSLLGRIDKTLEADHKAAEGPQFDGGDFNGRGPGPDHGSRCFSSDVGVYVVLRSSGGTQLCHSEPGSFTAASPPKLPTTITGLHQQGPDRVVYFTVPAETGGERYRVRASVEAGSSNMLILATSLGDVDSTLHRLLLIELLVSLGVVAGIALLGLWIVRLGLRPLTAIEHTADAIAEGDLSQRVARAEDRTEVGRLGLVLNAMLDRIEASDQRLRRFVADASHELRTPLAAVRAYAELFGRGAATRPDDLQRAMTGIGRESERMSSLVEDLLLLARLDEGRPLEREPVQLDELVREAVETSRAVDASHPIEVVAEPAAVLGDRTRLRQVLDNLLANVRSHTPPGTGVHVSVGRDGDDALLEVADDGPGMTAEQAERVFERFYRADSSRARVSGGVGLGLSIVAAVVDAHGGRVAVDSEPGRGTTFRIRLPLAPRQPAEAGASNSDVRTSSQTSTR